MPHRKGAMKDKNKIIAALKEKKIKLIVIRPRPTSLEDLERIFVERGRKQ